MSQTFGTLILNARKAKGYSQRELAGLVQMDFTYLSKLENNRADYPPKEDVIRALALHLELDAEELICLAGRLPQGAEELFKQYYKEMPALLRRMRDNPEYAQKVLQDAAVEGEEP